MPCKTNPLGIKGAGEVGSTGAPPAVINALLDALSPLGARLRDTGDAGADLAGDPIRT